MITAFFLTATLVVVMMGKMADITAASETTQAVFITLAIVSGCLNMFSWAVADNS